MITLFICPSAVIPKIADLTDDDVTGDILGDDLVITPTIFTSDVQVAWSHSLNDAVVLLSPDTDIRVEILEGGVLTVRDVQASDRGTYTVRATNEFASVEASVDVIIECEFNFTLLLLLLLLLLT